MQYHTLVFLSTIYCVKQDTRPTQLNWDYSLIYVQIVYKNYHDYKPIYWGEEEKVLLVELFFLDSSALGLSLKIKTDDYILAEMTEYNEVKDRALYV